MSAECAHPHPPESRRALAPRRWELDLESALRSAAPVLITAGTSASLAIARRLSLHTSPRPLVVSVDCRQPQARASLRTLIAPDSQRVAVILLLQEVHALEREDQLALEAQLERLILHPHTGPSVRILASSSVPLFTLVLRQAFRRRLYYLLNMIQIEPPPGMPSG